MDVITAIRTRRSVRSYSPQAIPPQAVARLKDAARWAPTACNLQPWNLVFVTDEPLRRDLAHAACDQRWIAEAPLVVAACGYPEKAYQHMGGQNCSLDIDVAIMLDHLVLAAVAEGLGTCWIGAFDEPQVKLLLRVPAAVRVIAMIPVGYPAYPELLSPADEGLRKPPAQLFSSNAFGQVE